MLVDEKNLQKNFNVWVEFRANRNTVVKLNKQFIMNINANGSIKDAPCERLQYAPDRRLMGRKKRR